jgi:ribosomal protein L29
MDLPTQDDLRAKLPEEVKNSVHATRLENLKFRLEQAYEAVENNKKSHIKIRKY